MNEGESAMESVWTWIKTNEPNNLNPTMSFEFSAQQVSEQLGRQGVDHHVLDALWQLVTAGILVPTASTRQFRLSGWGEQAIKQDRSPYQKHKFLAETQVVAPNLDIDSLAYLSLALDCMYRIPTATIALIRVALEIEIDSVIEAFIQSQNLGNTARRNLSDRNIRTRVEELLNQLRSRTLIPEEDSKLFESYINQIRISGNRVLHPKDGVPLVDSLLVQSVIHAFASFANMASELKVTLR